MLRAHPLQNQRNHSHNRNKEQAPKKKEQPRQGSLLLCNCIGYLCGDQFFLLHDVSNIASEGLGYAFAVLRIAFVEVIDLLVLDRLLDLTESSRDVADQPLLRIWRHETEEVPRLGVVVAVMLAVAEPAHRRGAVRRGTLDILRVLGRTAEAVRLIVRRGATIRVEAHG